jgi:nitrile hydratase
LRTKALESLLVQKGLVDPAALDLLIETYQTRIGPQNGARVVAHAWVDATYKERLLADATKTIAELGFTMGEADKLIVVENGPKVHNLVVCTLCSCYPWTLLGLPPSWYKSDAYRSRAVIDPRGVLRDFGVMLPDETEIRVWDSTAEVRYLVLPERPAGTESTSEQQLAGLVTRDSMIGEDFVALKAPLNGIRHWWHAEHGTRRLRKKRTGLSCLVGRSRLCALPGNARLAKMDDQSHPS